MSRKTIVRRISLEQIVSERLPPKTIDNIDLVEIEVWEIVESGLSFYLNKDEFNFTIKLRFPTKKILAWIMGIIGFTISLVTIIDWLIPILEAYYNKSPPLP